MCKHGAGKQYTNIDVGNRWNTATTRRKAVAKRYREICIQWQYVLALAMHFDTFGEYYGIVIRMVTVLGVQCLQLEYFPGPSVETDTYRCVVSRVCGLDWWLAGFVARASFFI